MERQTQEEIKVEIVFRKVARERKLVARKVVCIYGPWKVLVLLL